MRRCAGSSGGTSGRSGRKLTGCSSSGRRCRRKPEELVKQELAKLRQEDALTPDLVFRDPYLLDFLGLKDAYNEKDLEMAILREMEQFILELGVGFTFVARQKRIVIDGEDFFLDLLFYHRKLRRTYRRGTQAREIQGRRQGATGALPPLAGKARNGAGGGDADRADPLCRQG